MTFITHFVSVIFMDIFPSERRFSEEKRWGGTRDLILLKIIGSWIGWTSSKEKLFQTMSKLLHFEEKIPKTNILLLVTTCTNELTSALKTTSTIFLFLSRWKNPSQPIAELENRVRGGKCTSQSCDYNMVRVTVTASSRRMTGGEWMKHVWLFSLPTPWWC